MIAPTAKFKIAATREVSLSPIRGMRMKPEKIGPKTEPNVFAEYM